MGIENKPRVVKLFGGSGSAKGCLDAKRGMVTQRGTIVQIISSGTYVVSCSGAGVGTLTRHYPDELQVTEAVASGTWAWPTGVGSVTFGRPSVWASGVSRIPGTGMYFNDGDGHPVPFSRP